MIGTSSWLASRVASLVPATDAAAWCWPTLVGSICEHNPPLYNPWCSASVIDIFSSCGNFWSQHTLRCC